MTYVLKLGTVSISAGVLKKIILIGVVKVFDFGWYITRPCYFSIILKPVMSEHRVTFCDKEVVVYFDRHSRYVSCEVVIVFAFWVGVGIQWPGWRCY